MCACANAHACMYTCLGWAEVDFGNLPQLLIHFIFSGTVSQSYPEQTLKASLVSQLIRGIVGLLSPKARITGCGYTHPAFYMGSDLGINMRSLAEARIDCNCCCVLPAQRRTFPKQSRLTQDWEKQHLSSEFHCWDASLFLNSRWQRNSRSKAAKWLEEEGERKKEKPEQNRNEIMFFFYSLILYKKFILIISELR